MRVRELAALGAEVAKADSEDSAALERTCAGAHGVYSVQNHHISGYDGEIRQGKKTADAEPLYDRSTGQGSVVVR